MPKIRWAALGWCVSVSGTLLGCGFSFNNPVADCGDTDGCALGGGAGAAGSGDSGGVSSNGGAAGAAAGTVSSAGARAGSAGAVSSAGAPNSSAGALSSAGAAGSVSTGGAPNAGTAGASVSGGEGGDLGRVFLQAPVHGAFTNQRTPTLSWYENPFASSYELRFGTDPDLMNATTTTGISTTTFVLPEPLPSTARTTYYWSVTPVDAHGTAGSPSPIESFNLDTEALTGGTISLAGGAEITHDHVVSVSLTIGDPLDFDEVYLSQDGSFTDGAWQHASPTSTREFTSLADTDQATITLHAKFRDRAGNVSDEVVDSIGLRRTLIRGPVITAPTEWTANDGPYVIVNNVAFDVGAPLVIGPGTEIFFKKNMNIDIRDQITAVGSASSPIVMHGARIELRAVSNTDPSYNTDGSYASGARFENIQLPDGALHVITERSFYLRNSTVSKVTGKYLRGAYIERSVIDDLEADGSFTILPWGGTYVNMNGSVLFNSYIKLLWLSGPVDMRRCAVGTFHFMPGADQPFAYNTFQQILLTHSFAHSTFHDNNMGSFTVEDPINWSNGPFDARNNYWGPTATAEMQAGTGNISTIIDVFDDSKLPRIDYSGFKSAPVVGAGPDW